MPRPSKFHALFFLVASAGISGADDAPKSRPAAPEFVLEWGTKGSKPGEFHSPVCLAFGPGRVLFVADLNNARVQKFGAEGRFLGAFDLPLDQPPRKSCLVGGTAFDGEGNLYLSFMFQHKIAVYSTEGRLLREWGSKGAGDGEFNQPGGLVFRPDGTLLVADQCNHRIQVFTSEGKFLRKWGGHGAEPGRFGGSEPAGSRFAGPHFLARDSKGRLYTTEGAAGRIQRFDPDGVPQAAWGHKTREPGAFGEYQFGNLKNTFGPIGVFVDGSDRVWVSSLNDRVQAFTPDGRFLLQLDGSDEDHPFLHPHGMAADDQGFLYVADSGNQRIVKFRLPAR